MPIPLIKIGRVFAGAIALFIAWLAGVYAGGSLFPDSQLINKMETLPTKTGGSLGILVASIFLSRFLFRRYRIAVISLGVTEAIVLLIIVCVTQLWSLALDDLFFNFGWLFELTWNVVLAFLLGSTAGHFWNKASPAKSPKAANAASAL